jgi:D-beta-D-heptose 7-phosphate kinase/D-beta-D-heptose 1-phosphate adenosyltransferase
MGKVIDSQELAALADNLTLEHKKIVTTNGCFDILHVGHIQILNQAKALGDVLIVGLNSDESVRKIKGSARPINNQADRAQLLANLIAVDYVFIFNEDTPVEFVKIAKPTIHAKGQDYTDKALAEAPIVESLGGRVELLPLVQSKSTTGLIEKIKSL